MIKMPFLLLNDLNDINCGQVRKCVMPSIYLLDNTFISFTVYTGETKINDTYFIRFGSKLYRQIVGTPMGSTRAVQI